MKCITPSKRALEEAEVYGQGELLTDKPAEAIRVSVRGVEVMVYWKGWDGCSATWFTELEEGTEVKRTAGKRLAASTHMS